MRRRAFAAFVLFVTFVGLIGACEAAIHVAESFTETVEDRASEALATSTQAALTSSAKVTASMRQVAPLGASMALVGLLLGVRFANCATLFARPGARARGTRQRRAPPRFVV